MPQWEPGTKRYRPDGSDDALGISRLGMKKKRLLKGVAGIAALALASGLAYYIVILGPAEREKGLNTEARVTVWPLGDVRPGGYAKVRVQVSNLTHSREFDQYLRFYIRNPAAAPIDRGWHPGELERVYVPADAAEELTLRCRVPEHWDVNDRLDARIRQFTVDKLLAETMVRWELSDAFTIIE